MHELAARVRDADRSAIRVMYDLAER